MAGGMRVAMNYRDRAAENFAVSREAIAADIRALIADHASRGLLQNGATAKKSLEIFESHTSAALSKSLDETAKQVEHRGRAWKAATASVAEAFDEHLGKARDALAKPLIVAGATGDSSAAREVDKRITAMGERLRRQLDEFSEGWTAPQAKPWKERHPNLDRLVFALAGAVISTGVIWLAALLGAS